MKKMDSLGLKLCGYQASLFETSIEITNCSSPIFIRRFMNSDLAKRIDSTGYLFEATTITEALGEIENQYGPSDYGTERYSREELHWIGYIYRYWAYVSDKTSRQLYRTIKPAQLKKLYFPYHSLDPMQAIERIMEGIAPEPESEQDKIAEGARILRKIRNRTAQQTG